MADSTIVFLVLAGVVVLFVSNRVPVEIVAVGTALTLWATGVLDIDQALAGFGDPTVVYIAVAVRRQRSPRRHRRDGVGRPAARRHGPDRASAGCSS